MGLGVRERADGESCLLVRGCPSHRLRMALAISLGGLGSDILIYRGHGYCSRRSCAFLEPQGSPGGKYVSTRFRWPLCLHFPCPFFLAPFGVFISPGICRTSVRLPFACCEARGCLDSRVRSMPRNARHISTAWCLDHRSPYPYRRYEHSMPRTGGVLHRANTMKLS
jgi:hypothetical protein